MPRSRLNPTEIALVYEALDHLKAEMGVTQKVLEAKTGFSQQQISGYYRRESVPSTAFAHKLATAVLGVSVDDFMQKGIRAAANGGGPMVHFIQARQVPGWDAAAEKAKVFYSSLPGVCFDAAALWYVHGPVMVATPAFAGHLAQAAYEAMPQDVRDAINDRGSDERLAAVIRRTPAEIERILGRGEAPSHPTSGTHATPVPEKGARR